MLEYTAELWLCNLKPIINLVLSWKPGQLLSRPRESRILVSLDLSWWMHTQWYLRYTGIEDLAYAQNFSVATYNKSSVCPHISPCTRLTATSVDLRGGEGKLNLAYIMQPNTKLRINSRKFMHVCIYISLKIYTWGTYLLLVIGIFNYLLSSITGIISTDARMRRRET